MAGERRGEVYRLKLFVLPIANTIILVLADCERIRVPALEGVRRLILGSVCNNAGDLTSAQSNYLAAIDEGEALGDVHASAFASYELGMLVCKNASTMTVRQHHFATIIPLMSVQN